LTVDRIVRPGFRAWPLRPVYCQQAMKNTGIPEVLGLARQLLGMREISYWSSSTDRRLGYSGIFPRGIARSGRLKKAILASGKGLSGGLVDRFLAESVNWWARLSESAGVDEMVLLVPGEWSGRIRQMLPILRIPLRCLEYDLTAFRGREIFPGGTVETDLDYPYVIYPGSRPPGVLERFARDFPELDLVFRRDTWELSFFGLPVVWTGDRGECWFDFQRPTRLDDDPLKCLEHIRAVENTRAGAFANGAYFSSRFGPERWLESMLVKNLSLVRPALGPMFYSQVPTMVDGERRVLDILTVDREGTLVVLEVKTECRTEDVFQGLGYRKRIAWHQQKGDFRRKGYFPGIDLNDRIPILGFVSPLFAFHRSMADFWRHLDPGGEIFFVGVNADWRKGVRPLRRFSPGWNNKHRESFPYP